MFEHKLSLSSSNEDTSQEVSHRESQVKKRALSFQEILCPRTGEALSSANCSVCPYKEEFQRAHPLGFKMSTFICAWGDEEKEEEKECDHH